MRSFFKIFFASLLALIIFTLLGVFIGVWLIAKASQPDKPEMGSKGLLVLDLTVAYREQAKNNPFTFLMGDEDNNTPSLQNVVSLLHFAKTDSTVKGLYIKADNNPNGFATSEELRAAVIDFKQSKKFVVAYGEVISQKAFYVASAADKVYCHPSGGLEWSGFSSNLYFVKGLLDKLEIEPEIFYAGKFKSATEPFRATQMTEPNRLQTTVWLGDLYNHFLWNVAQSRSLDTAQLRALAFNGTIQRATDALQNHLVDGLKYSDEMNTELTSLTKQKENDKLNFISLSKYAKANNNLHYYGKDKIAVLYADGEIVNGKGQDGQIGSDEFVKLIQKLRLDSDIKAIVFRVNSPGGSSLASDAIWREIVLAKKAKPVVISMGNYAASGGYYISCAGDSIFADPGTITGSIGVFSIMPNLQSFFKNKLGVTFDGVKTGPYADMGSSIRPLSNTEKNFLQADVDSIYFTFKSRVAEGRKKDIAYIDSIAQGRVWTGQRAIDIGLVDKISTLNEAIECAARLAKTKDYRTKSYPEEKNILEQLLSGSFSKSVKVNAIKEEIGTQQYNMLLKLKSTQSMFGEPQARLPFEFDVQ